MIDFGKLYCDLHPNEIISNFCLGETCLVGLCATCICTHTEYHTNNKTVPEYQNIRNTFSSMHDSIRARIDKLQMQKNRIDKITEFIQTKRRTIKENVETTRMETIQAVNNFFDHKEKSMMRQLQNQQKKMGLHSDARMDSLMNSLSRQTGNLILAAQQLNSLSFLESYQRIKCQTLVNAQKLQEDISKELDKNQDFQTIIHTNQDYLNGLIRSLQKSLNLDFKMNRRAYVNIITTPIKQSSNQSQKNSQAACFLNRAQSQPSFYPAQNKSHKLNSLLIQNNFSAMTFKNMPDNLLNQLSPIRNHLQGQNMGRVSGTSQSILIQDEQLLTNKNYSEIVNPGINIKESIIQPLARSQFIVEAPSQRLFRDSSKQNNIRSQSVNNKNISNRNHQSQIILNQNKRQDLNAGQTGLRNHHHSTIYDTIGHKNLTTSQMTNVPTNFSNMYIQDSKRQAIGQTKVIQTANTNNSANSNFNFVPQVFNGGNFLTTPNNIQNSDHRKIRKSGLTLLKLNQQGQENQSSRSKLGLKN